MTCRSKSIIGKVVDKSIDLFNLSIKVDNHKVLSYRFVSTFVDFYRHQHVKETEILCISMVSVKSCTALIMAIKLNKVALKPERSRCHLVQSATECLSREI